MTLMFKDFSKEKGTAHENEEATGEIYLQKNPQTTTRDLREKVAESILGGLPEELSFSSREQQGKGASAKDPAGTGNNCLAWDGKSRGNGFIREGKFLGGEGKGMKGPTYRVWDIDWKGRAEETSADNRGKSIPEE